MKGIHARIFSEIRDDLENPGKSAVNRLYLCPIRVPSAFICGKKGNDYR